MSFWSTRWPKLKWSSTQTLIMLCASCWVTVFKKNCPLQVSASCHFIEHVKVCNWLKCAPWCFIQDFHNSVPFRLWEKTSICSQEMWGLASPAFWKQQWWVTLFSQMENHFPLGSDSQRFVFFFPHVSAHHISCMSIRIWRNLTLACADMESVTQMTMATSTNMISTQEEWVWLYVLVCLPLNTA